MEEKKVVEVLERREESLVDKVKMIIAGYEVHVTVQLDTQGGYTADSCGG